jgi:hypothetical protein
VLTVILIPEEHPARRGWLGVTAWVAKGRDLREYELGKADDEQGADSDANDEEEERADEGEHR